MSIQKRLRSHSYSCPRRHGKISFAQSQLSDVCTGNDPLYQRFRSDAATYTKYTTRTSYAERFYHQVQMTPLRTFTLVAAFVASNLLVYGSSILIGTWSWWGLKYSAAQSGGLEITQFMQLCSLLTLISALVDTGNDSGHTTIGFSYIQNSTLKIQLVLFMVVVHLLGYLLQTLKAMIRSLLPELIHQDMAPFEILMPVASFHSFRLINRLLVSVEPALRARVEFLRAQVARKYDHGRRHSLCDSCDESETHDEHVMRSSYKDHAIDSSDPVPAVSERDIRHSTSNCTSTARDEHISTLSNANKSIGIARKLVQYEQPEKNQEQPHGVRDCRADAIEVTAEVAQPLSEQAELVVWRRPRQRQRIIVLNFDEDTAAVE
jgi:hypothetical protein